MLYWTSHLKLYVIKIVCHNCTNKSYKNYSKKDEVLEEEEIENEMESEAEDEENNSNDFSSYRE